MPLVVKPRDVMLQAVLHRILHSPQSSAGFPHVKKKPNVSIPNRDRPSHSIVRVVGDGYVSCGMSPATVHCTARKSNQLGTLRVNITVLIAFDKSVYR